MYFCGCSPGFDFVFSILVKRFAGKSISETTLFCVECDVKPSPVVTSNISSELKDDVSGERALTRVTADNIVEEALYKS